MVTALGASAFDGGLIEGFAEATALMVKVFSGAFSDYCQHRVRSDPLTLERHRVRNDPPRVTNMMTIGFVMTLGQCKAMVIGMA
jgi:hypothetical protein